MGDDVMCQKKQNKREEKKSKMAALATPKKNSYIIKKDCVSKIINSKTSKAKEVDIKTNALLFRKNNLRKEK